MDFPAAQTVPIFFDLATATGWAVRSLEGRRHWGSFALPRIPQIGRFLQTFEDRVDALYLSHAPTVVIYEAPFVGSRMPRIMAMKLFGLASHLEYICHRRRIPCFEEARSEVVKFYCGSVPKGRAMQKIAVMREARRRGFLIANDDEADALAGLDLVCHRMKMPGFGGRLFASGPDGQAIKAEASA